MYEKERSYIDSCIRTLVSRLSTTYFGCILSHLNLKLDPSISCDCMITCDGDLVFNPTIESVQKQDIERTLRDLLHEAGHIALEHFARKEALKVEGANHEKFNIAADCAVESFLDADFPTLKGDPKHHSRLEQHIPRAQWGLHSTEQLYSTIKQPDPKPSQDKSQENHIPTLSAEGKQQLKNALQQAAQQAKETIIEAAEKEAATNTNGRGYRPQPQQGKGDNGIGASSKTVQLLRLEDDIKNLTSLNSLSRLFTKTFGRGESKDDSVFNQRNMLRRQFMGSPLLGRHQRTEAESEGEIEQWHNDVTILCDISGSMSTQAIINAFKWVLKLAVDYGVAPVTVHTYNNNLVESYTIDQTTNLSSLNIRTGGGTNINNVLDRVKPNSALVLVLTDMEDSPVKQWDYKGKLVWLIHDNSHTSHDNFKLGEKIYINDIIGKQ